MEDCIYSLEDASVFTMLDYIFGYWKFPIALTDLDKTTSTSHLGTYWYSRTLLVTRNAPVTFPLDLDIIVSVVHWRTCLMFFDDIVTFPMNMEDHIDHVNHIVGLLGNASVKFKIKKCIFKGILVAQRAGVPDQLVNGDNLQVSAI